MNRYAAAAIAVLLMAVTPAPAVAVDVPDNACALRSGYDFLRDLAFSSAVTDEPGKSVPLNRLKRAVRAEATDAHSVAYDPASGRIDCALTLRLMLPASSRPYFGGAEMISAPVRFSAEPDSAGNGYNLVTRGLAVLEKQIVSAARRFPQTPDFGEATPPVPVAPTAITPATTPTQSMAPVVAPVAAKRRAGFDCARAVSHTEKLICDSEALAESDRLMSEQYFARRARLRSPDRAALLVSQRRFLRLRDRCDSEGCLVGLYMARQAELDHLATASPRKR